MGCHTVGRWLPSFRNEQPIPSSKVQQSNKKKGLKSCPETSVASHQSMSRNIPEERRLRSWNCITPWLQELFGYTKMWPNIAAPLLFSKLQWSLHVSPLFTLLSAKSHYRSCFMDVYPLGTALLLYRDRRFTTLQRTLFIYLINKYISLSDICLTVHHWYK